MIKTTKIMLLPNKKDLAICFDGKTYGNIHKIVKVKKLKKNMRKLQHRISKK